MNNKTIDESDKPHGNSQRYQSWLGISFLLLFALLYCFSALISPFWGDNDIWSNLLPIIHFRQSILQQHTLPLYTDLWYGGRFQWMNPLWSFLYLPSTVIWLLFPLDWGTKIVLLGHLILALLAARALAGLFLKSEIEKVSTALILTSPILPALIAGHVEKVMSWGWILLAMFFLLNQNLRSLQRGLGVGICLGIVPLTGSNYYAFYGAILLVPLLLSYGDIKLFQYFCLGVFIGLPHLINVWEMIGHARVHAKTYIENNSVNLWSAISALTVGVSKHISWETWTPIGIFVVGIFGWLLVRKIAALFKSKTLFSSQEIALLFSTLVLFLFATGVAYQHQSWFDLFRVPSRALAFVALAIVMFVLLNVQDPIIKYSSLRLILLISVVQILAAAWFIRPQGSIHSPYEASIQDLAITLKKDHAKNVWISTNNLTDMYIHAGLTRNNLSLPNVYYGDMGQEIKIEGNYCGYSFDHILAFEPIKGTGLKLESATEWSYTTGEISLNRLVLLEKLKIDGKWLDVYRVACS